MRVLLLAPHAYYVVRGTPIDVDLVLRGLEVRDDVTVDALVYGEGRDRSYRGITLHRTPGWKWLQGGGPGFGWKKLVNDAFMFFRAWGLLRRNRYDVIHAGEEASLMALFFKRLHGVPYVYDLDSSIAMQMVEKYPRLRFVAGVFDRVERAAIRGAIAAAPVCNALAERCREAGAKRVFVLHDISQLENPDGPPTGRLAAETGSDRLHMLYAGNLEPYQGIDLLLDAFGIAARETDAIDLVVLGGTERNIVKYRKKADALGLADRVHFLGPRPFTELERYLLDADVLVAPRTRGVNTPMKVFPYLHSGRAVLVTDLPTHTQILTPDVCVLAAPRAREFADAIVRLAEDAELRRRIGAAGRAFAEAGHTFDAHLGRMKALYDWLEDEVRAAS
ncbi:MAG: glycosyltransferase family 4 protein [Gemmatimonadota bacterium]|nr:glycosyltransferase family 4 protein [Gemmatimonadota bacterium]